jgi:hypothetical protein
MIQYILFDHLSITRYNKFARSRICLSEVQQPDVKLFANAVVKEVNGHVNNKNWTLVR